MKTFSQLVDAIVRETGRPDMVNEIITYLNQTVRECHADPVSNGSLYMHDNLQEMVLVATQERGQVWNIPNPATFQHLWAVQYMSVHNITGNQPYATFAKPGPAMHRHQYSYYRASGGFAFAGQRGYGGTGARIGLAFYEFLPSLRYYPLGQRPLEIGLDGEFIYSEEYDVSEERRLEAQRLTTHWMLIRWDMVLEEGLRAKVYKRLSDTERARTCYSLYLQQRANLSTSETAQTAMYNE